MEYIKSSVSTENNIKETDLLKERTAQKIMRQIQEQMIIWLPFLNRAVLRMPYIPSKKPDADEELTKEEIIDRIFPTTNGNGVYAAPDVIIDIYRKDRVKLSRIFLHMIFHCLFCHPFRYEMLEVKIWDFAADIAVEGVILELSKKELFLASDPKKQEFIELLKKKIKPFTADNIYHYYYKNRDEYENDSIYEDAFRADSHLRWITENDMLGGEIMTEDGENDFAIGDTENMWKKTSEAIMLMDTVMQHRREDIPGGAIENIRQLYKEKRSYEELLKRFVTFKEEIKVNIDEFDYIYYTYGMKLYGNLPLIEPLEYQDMNKIHDFVIAIDTSGSCQGKVVRSFLNKTYSILKETGFFFYNMNVHIIQCDSKVQSDDKITSQTEFDNYISNLKIRGYGGTDFRPVFELVDGHIRSREFGDLKGMIYFTDGIGIYPKIGPNYPVAFVIIEDDYEKPNVPAWAIKMITSIEELDRK